MQKAEITDSALRAALHKAGTVTGAAAILGVSRVTLYRLMARYGIGKTWK